MTPISPITGDKPKQKWPDRTWRILPAGSKFPTIRGQWERLSNGRVLAWYTTQQLAQCKKMFEIVKGARPVREQAND